MLIVFLGLVGLFVVECCWWFWGLVGGLGCGLVVTSFGFLVNVVYIDITMLCVGCVCVFVLVVCYVLVV